MGEVIRLHPLLVGEETLSVKKMFDGIIELNNPKHAFVICWPEDGKLPSYHSTTGDIPVVLLRLQEFIHKYYNGEFNGD